MQPVEPEPTALTLLGDPLPLVEFLELLRAVESSGQGPLGTLASVLSTRHLAKELQPAASLGNLWDDSYAEENAVASARQRVLVALGLDSQLPALDPLYDDPSASLRLFDPLSELDTRVRARVEFSRDPRTYVHNLVLHAESEDIAVTWESHSEFLGGFVYRHPGGRGSVRRDPSTAPSTLDADDLPRVSRADVILVLNHRQDWLSTFDVLTHELAHVLLGHLGPMRGAREGRLAITEHRILSQAVREVEANAVAAVVTEALGRISPVIRGNLVSNVFKAAKASSLESVDVLGVFIAAEILCAWCMSPPQRLGVTSGPREKTPTRPIGWKTRVRNDEGENR